jgi:hypothetical protein
MSEFSILHLQSMMCNSAYGWRPGHVRIWGILVIFNLETIFFYFHSRTVHLDIIKVLLPTDTQEKCFKRNTNIYLFIKSAPKLINENTSWMQLLSIYFT